MDFASGHGGLTQRVVIGKGVAVTIVAIDGVDGTGKSTLAAALVSSIRDAILVPEFSSDAMGRFLSEQVSTKPHFIAESELAQSLLFLAEYVERCELIARTPESSSRGVVFLERGWLSKYSYQVNVLERRYSHERSSRLVLEILNMIAKPDFTILLTASESALRRRLRGREVVVDANHVDFLKRSELLMLRAIEEGFDAFVIDTSSLSAKEVADAAERYVRSVVHKECA